MKVHHIGYITDCIDASVNEFRKLGYVGGEIISDAVQNCKICLLISDRSNDCIELVEPNDDNYQMQKILKIRGCSAYHICYEVEDVESVYNDYCEKEGWINIFKPVAAVALGGRKITYFYNTKIGFIEFVNEK